MGIPPVKTSLTIGQSASPDLRTRREAWEGEGWTRRRFLAGVAVGAGALALPIEGLAYAPLRTVFLNRDTVPLKLPSSFGDYVLAPGVPTLIPAYSSVSGPDRDFVVAQALASKLSFPGDSTQGVYAGFRVTRSLTYVLNGQEPADQPEGTTVYSIDDGDIREYVNRAWRTRGCDSWSRNLDATHGLFVNGMAKLKDGRVMRIGGMDETFTPTTYCAIFDPDHLSLGWVETAPFPGVQIPYDFQACTLKNGKVLVVGGGFNAEIDSTGPLDTNGGAAWLYDPKTNTWDDTGVIPEDFVNDTVSLCLLDNGNALCSVTTGTGFPFGTYADFSKKVYKYTTSSGTWSLTGLMTAAHGGCKISPLPGNKAYIVGGYEKFSPGRNAPGLARYGRKLEIFDHATGLWTAGPDMPSIIGEDTASTYANPDVDVSLRGSRGEHGHILVGRKIVVVGGDFSWNVDADWDGFTDIWGRSSIITYDLDAGTWNVMSGVAPASMPYPTEACFLYDIGNGRILIAGGFNYDTNWDDYRCWIYNVEDESLQSAADLPNFFSADAGFNLPLQAGFHCQDVNAISLNKNLAFYAGNTDYENGNGNLAGPQSEIYSTGNKGGKCKKHGFDDLTGPQKTASRNRGKARMAARRRRGG